MHSKLKYYLIVWKFYYKDLSKSMFVGLFFLANQRKPNMEPKVNVTKILKEKKDDANFIV